MRAGKIRCNEDNWRESYPESGDWGPKIKFHIKDAIEVQKFQGSLTSPEV